MVLLPVLALVHERGTCQGAHQRAPLERDSHRPCRRPHQRLRRPAGSGCEPEPKQSLLGVGSGLSVLPFAGLELWSAAVLVMGLTLWRSVRPLRLTACATASPGCGDPQRLSAAHLGVLALLCVATLIVISVLFVSAG